MKDIIKFYKTKKTHFIVKSENFYIGLTSSETIVYSFVSNFFKGKKGVCYATNEQISLYTGYCERTVIRALKKLEEMELIRVIRMANRRQILPPKESDLEKNFNSVYSKLKEND